MNSDYTDIVQTLKSLTDDVRYKDDIDRIIRGILLESSVPNKTPQMFDQLLRNFIAIVTGSAAASVFSRNLVQEAIRVFIKIWKNPDIGQFVMQTLYGFESLAVDDTSFPGEIKGFSQQDRSLYLATLQRGKEKNHNIRIMVVGMYGVGKTSLVKNIMKKDELIVKTTVGIDVFRLRINASGVWNAESAEDDQDYINRFVPVMENINKDFTPNIPFCDTVDHQDQSDDNVINDATDDTIFEKAHATIDEMLIDPAPAVVKYVKQLKQATEQVGKRSKSDSTPIATVSIWDFAGQLIYYTTHHFFLNSRSLYFLVMDLNRDLYSKCEGSEDSPFLSGCLQKDFTYLDAFKFWMQSIHMYSGQYSNEEKIRPSVILVGTHKDQLTGDNIQTDKQKEEFKDNYFDRALKSLTDSTIPEHVYQKKFLVDNNSPNKVFDDIKLEVINLAKSQHYWEEEIPAKWMQLDRSLEKFKANGREIIRFQELIDADSKNEYPVKKDDLKVFLKFQHMIGNVLYFDTDVLGDKIILMPQWIINAFKCFITHVPNKNPSDMKLWMEYEEKAILRPELIDIIIDKCDENRHFREFKIDIINYMEHLDIMAKPFVLQEKTAESSNNCTSNVSSNETMNFYIVPSLLKTKPANKEFEAIVNPTPTLEKTPVPTPTLEKTPVLCLEFNNRFMPPAIFHRLIAICIRKWKLSYRQDDGSKKFLLFNGLAEFTIDSNKLVLWFRDHIIYARLIMYAGRNKESTNLCVTIRKFLKSSLCDILEIVNRKEENAATKGLGPFEESIQCPNATMDGKCDGLLKVSELMQKQNNLCDFHQNHFMEHEPLLDLWFNEELPKNSPLTKRNWTDREPTEKELWDVVQHIGKEYRDIGCRLGITSERMDQIELDFDRYSKGYINGILLEWKKKKQPLEILRNAVSSCQRSNMAWFDRIFFND